MNFHFVLDPEMQALYLRGLWMTLKLMLLCISLSLLAAIPFALALNSRWKPLRHLSSAASYLIRGTPLLLQLYLIYFGLSQFQAVRESVVWVALSNPLFCALLAFVINEAAYTGEIIAGALRNLPHGEIEAARAFGMRPWTILKRISLPSALRASLPTYSNEVIIVLHGTSLATTVTLLDLTGAANEVYSTLYLPFEAFMVAAAFYMALTFAITRLFRAAETRFLAYQRPRTA
jgi:arginine/ornithine transport system permease protein